MPTPVCALPLEVAGNGGPIIRADARTVQLLGRSCCMVAHTLDDIFESNKDIA